MNDLRLIKSRPKNPPAKTVAEANRIKARVEKSNRKEKNVTIKTRLEDLPPLARKYVEENEGGMMLTDAGDRPATASQMRDLDGQVEDLGRQRLADRKEMHAERDQRIADEMDAKATSLMGADPNLDYGSAMRMAAANDENFAGGYEPPTRRLGEVHGTEDELREAVARRLAEYAEAPARVRPDAGAGSDDGREEPGPVRMSRADADLEEKLTRMTAERRYGDA